MGGNNTAKENCSLMYGTAAVDAALEAVLDKAELLQDATQTAYSISVCAYNISDT